MGLLGIHLSLLVGPTVPLPAPPVLAEALQSAEVTHDDQGRSGFELTFGVGRAGPSDMLDYPPAFGDLLCPFNRVMLVVTFGVVPRVLMDGVITQRELSPSAQPGQSSLGVTGEDVSALMDLEERNHAHPAQPEATIVPLLLLRYAQYGVTPTVVPPPSQSPPLPLERIPSFRGTDYAYLQEMAHRYGYVFYVAPGPVPFFNRAYWGPPQRTGLPQRALSVALGPATNVDSIRFKHNGLEPTLVKGAALVNGVPVPVQTFASTRMPPLAARPALLPVPGRTRTRLLEVPSGTRYERAYAHAQGVTNASTDRAVEVQGQLNALRYGDLLQPRGLVGLRGAGYSQDGSYYVRRVTHSIKRGEYVQRFTLTREGTGSLTPAVLP
ncbi:MAG TPA: hypothetical protein VIG99_16960 [Myxococcaceae bacterium]|jgi:hypothetical protein